jgi:hypothetical protein
MDNIADFVSNEAIIFTMNKGFERVWELGTNLYDQYKESRKEGHEIDYSPESARQGVEKQGLSQREQIRAKADFPEMKPVREVRQSTERMQHEIEPQRQREAQGQAQKQQEREFNQEPNTQKPAFGEVIKAEEGRNTIERATLSTQQEKALDDALKAADKRGLGPVDKEQIQKFMEEKFKERQEKLAREQRERGDRLEVLYRGPPSERER